MLLVKTFKHKRAITVQKIAKQGAHLHITGRKSAKFQKNLMEDIGAVMDTIFVDGNSQSNIHIRPWSHADLEIEDKVTKI